MCDCHDDLVSRFVMSTLTKDSSHRMTLAQVAEKDMVGTQ